MFETTRQTNTSDLEKWTSLQTSVYTATVGSDIPRLFSNIVSHHSTRSPHRFLSRTYLSLHSFLMTKDDCANCTICRSNHLYVLDCNNDLVRTPPSIDAMSTKSVVSDSDRMLRNVTIWMWLPAFPFLLAHGIMTNQLRPVLGIIPVTFSAISGLVHVSGRARYRPANIFTAMFLLGIMIPGWVFMASNNCWHCTDEVNSSIVGTYGTVPMIINLHGYPLPSHLRCC